MSNIVVESAEEIVVAQRCPLCRQTVGSFQVDPSALQRRFNWHYYSDEPCPGSAMQMRKLTGVSPNTLQRILLGRVREYVNPYVSRHIEYFRLNASRALPRLLEKPRVCNTGKRPFLSEDAADRAAVSMTRANLFKSRELDRTCARSYYCWCGRWHITSLSPQKKEVGEDETLRA